MRIKYITNINCLYNKKIYIYGRGELAYDLTKWLQNHNFCVNAYIVDDEFVDDKKASIPLSAFKKTSNDLIVYGIASPDKLKSVQGKKLFDEIYILFNAQELWTYNAEQFLENKEKYDKALMLFDDELSRKTMKAFLYAHKTGDGNGLISTMSDNIYFNELVPREFMRKGCFVDCGACSGDTVTKFEKWIGEGATIYAFEPDRGNYGKLCASVGANVKCINKGTWCREDTLSFVQEETMASHIDDGGNIKIEVTTIDNVVGEDTVAFIKMDVEGSEFESLLGAVQTIHRDMPVLAISAYHRIDDLWRLPQKIKELENKNSRYKLYLRNHSFVAAELVLYAIPV